MEHRGIGRDDGILVPNKRIIHFLYGRKWPVTVFDDIRVAEMRVCGNKFFSYFLPLFQYVLFRIAVEKLFFLIDRQPKGIEKVKCFTATLKRIVGAEHYVLYAQFLQGALKSLL